MTDNAGTITWLGHATLLLEAPDGRKLLIDPWIEGNPKFPDAFRPIESADVIALTHAHGDHLGDTVEVAARTGAPVVCVPELAAYLGSRGVSEVVEMNKGGTVDLDGLRITMVPAQHSSGLAVDDGPQYDGGEPVGFILRHEGMATTYVAGDTTVFGDMRLIRDLYAPELGIVPIDGNYNMGPYEAAYALELLGVPRALPVHWGTFPLLAGTPDALRDELARRNVTCEVLALDPGDSASLAG
jgi:L-ascorbate metabolism protein UlaG (beta-lactamase superfamily)